jgi:Fe-S-cluster containining protein
MQALETDLARVASLAARDDDLAFVYFVDIMWDREARPDAELDALVDRIAAEIVPQIDCTACAHCCRSIPIGLTPADIPILAQAVQMAPDQFAAHHVDRESAAADGEWGYFRAVPCAFLGGSRCSIYAARPRSCRDYPAFTPDFRWQMFSIIQGAAVCPIIFNVIERLKHELRWTE